MFPCFHLLSIWDIGRIILNSLQCLYFQPQRGATLLMVSPFFMHLLPFSFQYYYVCFGQSMGHPFLALLFYFILFHFIFGTFKGAHCSHILCACPSQLELILFIFLRGGLWSACSEVSLQDGAIFLIVVPLGLKGGRRWHSFPDIRFAKGF